MKKMILALLAALTFAAPAHAQTQTDLLGNWRCDLSDPTLTMSITTTYMGDGEFVSVGTSQAQTPNGRLDLHMAASGAWRLENGQIIETVQNFGLFSAALDGAEIAPDAPLHARLLTQLRSTAHQPNVRTLISLTPEAYEIAFEGYRQTCYRRR